MKFDIKKSEYIPGSFVFGCGCNDRNEFREDCYNYQEIRDMGAHIPTCRLESKLGMCSCEGCRKFVSKEEIQNVIHKYLQNKYAENGNITDSEKVIKGLEALYDAMHKNQCYACSHEFIEVAENFGTEIVAEAIDLLKRVFRSA